MGSDIVTRVGRGLVTSPIGVPLSNLVVKETRTTTVHPCTDTLSDYFDNDKLRAVLRDRGWTAAAKVEALLEIVDKGLKDGDRMSAMREIERTIERSAVLEDSVASTIQRSVQAVTADPNMARLINDAGKTNLKQITASLEDRDVGNADTIEDVAGGFVRRAAPEARRFDPSLNTVALLGADDEESSSGDFGADSDGDSDDSRT